MATNFDPDERYRDEFDEREIQREVEAAEEQLERNTRTLADVFVEFMESGDRVEVAVGDYRCVGCVVGVGSDLVTLDADGRRADVALNLLTLARVVAAKSGPGRAYQPADTDTIVARLRELAGVRAGTTAELAGPDLGPVVATVVAVSGAHVELTTLAGELWVVPVSSIGVVVSVPD